MVGIALFVGVIGSLSISLIAGARRSASVVDRFFAAAPQYEGLVFAQSFEKDGRTVVPQLARADVARLSGVERADPAGYINFQALDGSGAVIGGIDALQVDFTAPPDRTTRVLRGTMPDGSDPYSVVINEAMAQNLSLSPGDTLNVKMFAPDQLAEVERGVYEPKGPTYALSIVAIARPASDIVLDEARASAPRPKAANEMLVSSRFWEQHHTEFLDFPQGYYVKLTDGQRGVDALNAALPSLLPPGEGVAQLAPDFRAARPNAYATPVNLETTALLALGIGVAALGVIVLVLVLRAEQRFHDRDTVGLRALGVTSHQLATIAALRVLPASLVGGLVAVLGAIALSARFPIGIGRQLELDRGYDVNIAVVTLGALGIVALVIVVGLIASRSRRADLATAGSPATSVGWLQRVGAPTTVALGARVAFENPRGRRSPTAVPGVVSGAVAIVIVATLAIWMAGVNHLYQDSASHGWPWDVAVGNSNFTLTDDSAARLAVDPRVAAQTRAAYGQATINGTALELFAIDPAGTAPPVVMSGRLPARADEIALGTRAIRKLGVAVGDKVTLSFATSEFNDGQSPTSDVEATVVGTALAPMFGESDLGDPSVVTLDAVRAGGGNSTAQMVALRLTESARKGGAAQLAKDYTEEQLTDIVPARVVNMHRVRSIPMLGVLLAGALGTITLGLLVIGGARIHRRNFAVLRALGLDARHLSGVLAWQGVLTAALMVAIGLPLGAIAGVALWHHVAADTGVAPTAVVPPALLVLVPATLAVAILCSFMAGHRVRRTQVARLLREE